jgi:Arc/MetJ family transcription regulator
MAMLRIGSKYSHTDVYAALFRRTAPCHETLIHIFEMSSNIFERKDLPNILLMCIFIQNNTHRRKIMRTNIVIDDNLMAEALKLSQLKTKKAVVETGLRLLIRIKKQERIKSIRGKLNWDGDLEKMRLDQ